MPNFLIQILIQSNMYGKDPKSEQWYWFGNMLLFTFPSYKEGRREGEFPSRSPVGGGRRGKRYRGGQIGPSYVALCTKGGRGKTDRGIKVDFGTDRDGSWSLGRSR